MIPTKRPRGHNPAAVDDALDLAVERPRTDAFIIDDDKPLAEVFHQVLVRRGLSVRTFSGRAELESVPRKEWAELMILDLSLGESDAIEVIQILAAANYDGAVALMSGRGEERLNQVQKIGLRRGLTMLTPLAKPIRSEQIDKLVRYVESLDHADPPHSLDMALDAGWIDFWYQPQIHLASSSIVGLECLARMRHPTRGLLTPDAFVPSRGGAALDRLTIAAITAACRDWSRLHKAGMNLRMAVNAPVSSLLNPEFVPVVRAILPNSEDWPGLTVEVTETEIIRDLDAAYEAAVRLGLYKVDVSIDDFGTGYSSLSRVRALPFAEIKIDKTFVMGVSKNPKAAAVCEVSVQLARRFGRKVVAEGIESAEDLKVVADMGCDFGQGYFFDRPKPIDAIDPATRAGPAVA